ncbi:MAG: ParB N-terminal domain-containing protein [Coriobacteriia bacterium]|nr:ParB N-terminal domain-containing protein [Coriobacteriia bacterium]
MSNNPTLLCPPEEEVKGAKQMVKTEFGDIEVVSVPIESLVSYLGHPFHVRDDEEMTALVVSVKEYGVLSPAIARIKDEGHYELISGHRRKSKRACWSYDDACHHT